jgi:hypothetical protein
MKRFFKCLIAIAFFSSSSSVLAQDLIVPKYEVAVWEARFEELLIEGLNSYRVSLKNNARFEGVLILEFNTENLTFDLDKRVLRATMSRMYIVRKRDNSSIAIITKFTEPTNLSLNLDGTSPYNAVMVNEKLDNGQTQNTWYRKVYDASRASYIWEVALKTTRG